MGPKRHRAAVAVVAANVLLGVSSLFWKALAVIPASTLLGYRILASLATLVLALLFTHGFGELRGKLTGRTVVVHVLAAFLVVVNWGTFIWASIHGHVVESGLGYLIAPLVAIAVGCVLWRERMTAIRGAALAAMALSILVLLGRSAELAHWVYLTIGVSWGGYVCLKKATVLGSFAGLFVETAVLTMCLPLLLWLTPMTLALPALSTADLLLLLSCGAVSVIPLALFAYAATGLPLSVIGYFQFVLPTTQLLVALWVYKQSVSPGTILCFAFIWGALATILVEPWWKAYQSRALPAAMK